MGAFLRTHTTSKLGNVNYEALEYSDQCFGLGVCLV